MGEGESRRVGIAHRTPEALEKLGGRVLRPREPGGKPRFTKLPNQVSCPRISRISLAVFGLFAL